MRKIPAAFLLFVALSILIFSRQTLTNPPDWQHRRVLMLGYSEMTETVVRLQTRGARSAQIRFWKRVKPESAHLSETVRTDEKSDFMARFKLTQLEFKTHYFYFAGLT